MGNAVFKGVREPIRLYAVENIDDESRESVKDNGLDLSESVPDSRGDRRNRIYFGKPRLPAPLQDQSPCGIPDPRAGWILKIPCFYSGHGL